MIFFDKEDKTRPASSASFRSLTTYLLLRHLLYIRTQTCDYCNIIIAGEATKISFTVKANCDFSVKTAVDIVEGWIAVMKGLKEEADTIAEMMRMFGEDIESHWRFLQAAALL